MDKKKIWLIIPMALVLLFLVVGTTYAYYMMSSTNNTTKSKYEVIGTPVGSVTFSSKVSDLRIKITPTDMAMGNIGNKYYAVTPDVEEDKGSLFRKEPQSHEIIRGVVKGTETNERYICDGTLKIEASNTMYSVLQPGDVKLLLMPIQAMINNEMSITLDMSDIKDGIQRYPVRFVIDKDTDTVITADMFMENRDVDQRVLANTLLEVSITLEDKPSCHIEVGNEFNFANEQIIETLRATDSKGQLSEDLLGGLYRYQGTDDVDNWICFGTSDKNKCTSADGIDKYLYRIIGVTEQGHLALIKETGVKNAYYENKFSWNSKYNPTDCGSDGSKCTWKDSDIFKRLNGLGNKSTSQTSGATGDSNIFIGNSYYEYLNVNSPWYNIISNHTWKYGDTTSNGSYIGDTMYNIENAFANIVNAKIGLQYIHDQHYACQGGQPGPNCNPNTTWINKKNNGETYNFEWLLTRYGYNSNSMNAWILNATTVNTSVSTPLGIARPVFYLTTNININNNTTGSKSDPYIIEGVPDVPSKSNEPKILTQLKSNNSQKQLTQDLVGGMYRYFGTDNVNNWICFGTTSNCSTSDDLIDKYMYRIIGVTPKGELALIKETGVKEGSKINFQWNNKYTTTDCGEDGSKCNWANSKLYNRLNGLCNSSNANCTGSTSGSEGDTNIFIGNSYYEYLSNNTWLSKISDHEWKYGDTNQNNGSYNGDNAYAIESKFTDSISDAKIGLQYLHDYYYAYPGGKPGSFSTVKNAWIHFRKDGYNTGISYEWLISKWGVAGPHVYAWDVYSYGTVNGYYLGNGYGVRPVFYLTSDTTFKDGNGSKEDPYIIEIPEPAIVTQLRQSDDNNSLSEDLVGGLYRYQGTDDVNNWICFGTSNEDECTGDIDKYMYRIIGVTPDGELALIKETGVKEGSTTGFQWNDKYKTSDCGTNGENCTWEKSRIYNRLNGLCKEGNENCDGTGSGYNGQSNIFIGNSYYEYLNNNSTWLEKINTHTWKYGSTDHDNGSYNGDAIYAIESKFTDSISDAKIGLQYINDYYYAYPGGTPGSYKTARNAWIHLSKDGTSGISYEWLISKYGVLSTKVNAWGVPSGGGVSSNSLNYSNGARPVFYLTPSVKINNASGSKTDPFIITN